MPDDPNSRPDGDDPMARMSNAVAEDYQPVDTDEDPDLTARGRSGVTAGPNADPIEKVDTEQPE